MKTRASIDSVFVLLEKVAGIIILLLVILTAVNVVARRAFNLPIFGITEIVEYGMLAAICLASANASFQREHPSVSLVTGLLSEKARTRVQFMVDFACMAVLSYVGAGLLPNIFSSESMQRVTESLGVPYVLVYVLIDLCIFVVALAYGLLAWRGAKELASGFDGGDEQ